MNTPKDSPVLHPVGVAIAHATYLQNTVIASPAVGVCGIVKKMIKNNNILENQSNGVSGFPPPQRESHCGLEQEACDQNSIISYSDTECFDVDVPQQFVISSNRSSDSSESSWEFFDDKELSQNLLSTENLLPANSLCCQNSVSSLSFSGNSHTPYILSLDKNGIFSSLSINNTVNSTVSDTVENPDSLYLIIKLLDGATSHTPVDAVFSRNDADLLLAQLYDSLNYDELENSRKISIFYEILAFRIMILKSDFLALKTNDDCQSSYFVKNQSCDSDLAIKHADFILYEFLYMVFGIIVRSQSCFEYNNPCSLQEKLLPYKFRLEWQQMLSKFTKSSWEGGMRELFHTNLSQDVDACMLSSREKLSEYFLMRLSPLVRFHLGCLQRFCVKISAFES